MHTIYDSETSTPGKQVITACAFIHTTVNYVPKVFLAKRADTKKFLPGVYELPGGHIDFGEEIEIGLKREIFEEFGINVSLGDPFYVFDYKNPVKGSHSVEVIYFAKFVDAIEKIVLNPEDHSRCDWFAEDEIEKALTYGKQNEDEEIKAIMKGFDLLQGGKLRFE